MEGLIPFVYRAIVEYKNNNRQAAGGVLSSSWFSESPSAAYIRLPGDSGRFQNSDIQRCMSDYTAPSSNAQVMMSSGVQSPVRRRIVAWWWSWIHGWWHNAWRKLKACNLVKYGGGLSDNCIYYLDFYFRLLFGVN